MSKKFLKVNWCAIDGAARQKKMLRLRANDAGLFICPVDNCMHTGFKSSRGLRKHIDSRHNWFYYFDNEPQIKREEITADPKKQRSKCYTHNVPAFSITEGIGADFHKWLRAPLGGGKNAREATQIARRGMKFLLHVMGDDFIVDSQASGDYIDCAIGTTSTVIRFMETVTIQWGMTSSGALNYVKSIADLADFRISQGVSDSVLRAFSATEVYLRRGKANLQKKKVMEYSRNLDLESLIVKDSWCSLEEMEKVIPFHATQFKDVHNRCANGAEDVSINDLAFASRFIATYLFLRVKCSRPRSFQFLTLEMLERARTNGGYVDQTEFKTASTYMFDTLIIDDLVFKILDMYTSVIRPRMKPQCNFVVISNSGQQYNSFTTAMTLLVKQAIGKYVHPTRLRQIVETTSSELLTPAEQEAVTADQKHNSHVAQRSYKKRLSREVAVKGKECMGKMLGESRSTSNQVLETILADTTNSINTIDEDVISRTQELLNLSPTRSVTLNPTYVVSNPNMDSESPWKPGEKETTAEESNRDTDLVITNVTAATSNTDVALSNINQLPSWPESAQPIIDVKEEADQTAGAKGRKKTKKFTPAEDNALIAGVKKYGVGHWGKILRDKEFKFDPSRARDSLRMRYSSAVVQRKAGKQEVKH